MKFRELLRVSRAEALFSSALPTSATPGRAEVDAAIAVTVRRLGGIRCCAAEMAAAYGERPEVSARRMRWALGVVSRTYPPRIGR